MDLLPIDENKLLRMTWPGEYVCAFLDRGAESRRVKRMLDRAKVFVQQIPIDRAHAEDCPRLVTAEHVYAGYDEIAEYCRFAAASPVIELACKA